MEEKIKIGDYVRWKQKYSDEPNMVFQVIEISNNSIKTNRRYDTQICYFVKYELEKITEEEYVRYML